jgi:Flp pilus assembly CpaF family ATPase
VILVCSTRADVRRAFINRLCEAAVKRSALVYAIAPSGGVNVTAEGVFRLYTHPTLSRRAILSAMLRHGANMLVFGEVATRDDVAQLLDAVYTGYHVVAEMYGESAHDALARLEAIGVDTSTLPANLRIAVPASS